MRIDCEIATAGSVLGIGWSLLHPMLMTHVLCVVFCPLFKADFRQFAPFLLAGLAFWNFLVSTASQGCQCFFQGEAYIRQQAARPGHLSAANRAGHRRSMAWRR